MGEKKTYLIWPNIMKAILIFTVVLAHSNHMPYKIGKIIYWFHMPCFFILSGIFFKIPKYAKNDIKNWIIKKILKMLVPCAVYFLLCTIIDGTFNMKKILYFLYGGKMIEGVYWFITVLFLTHIVLLVILTKLDIKSQWRTILLMYTAGVVWSNLMVPDTIVSYPMYLRFPWNADVVLIALLYVYIGYKCKNIICNGKMNRHMAIGLVSIVIIAVVVQAFISGKLSFILDMRYSIYKNWILTLIIPFCFFSIIFLISKVLEKIPGINKILYYIGDASLIIMYLHLTIKDCLIIPIWGEEYSIWMYFSISIGISIGVYFVSTVHPLTKWLLNGKY